MQKIKKARHLIMGIALSAAGAAQSGAKSIQEANEFLNEALKEGFHEIQVSVLKNTFTESGDPAYVQNEYIFIEYEDDEVVQEVTHEVAPAKVGRPKKVEEPVPA